MLCAFCRTEKLKQVKTNYERNIKGQRYIVENVPALFCETCGDYYYTNEVIKEIREKILDKQQTINSSTKVYNYESIL
jgi:YgiT-type zinc finger domain